MANYKSNFDFEKCEYKLDSYSASQIKRFHSLPEIAQDIYLSYFFDLSECKESKYDDLSFLKDNLFRIYGEVDLCNSPIEKTLYCALEFMFSLGFCGLLLHDYYVKPQYEIQTEKQKRIMDFAIIDESTENHDVVLFIECDGYDYHAKTKEQFENTNKRDREVRLLGYDILHFAGTEIYKNPLKCASETWKYIVKKEEQNGNI